MAGFLLMQFGSAKWFAFPGSIMPDGGTPPLGSLVSIAGMLEVVGGAFLVVGLFTRATAFLLAGEMAVAYFVAHAPTGFWSVLNGGALAALNCFVFLYLAAAGAGPWSLDGVRASRASSPETTGLPWEC
jgi:putative oxidoreductase